MGLQDEADWRADDLADKLIGHLSCRPEKATRQDVLTAMHEWLKSQLALLGVEATAQLMPPTGLVYCTMCNKTHSVGPDEKPCAPGAWLDPTPVRT